MMSFALFLVLSSDLKSNNAICAVDRVAPSQAIYTFRPVYAHQCFGTQERISGAESICIKIKVAFDTTFVHLSITSVGAAYGCDLC